MDNEVYGADDINFVMSRLTTSGVQLFNGGENTLEGLNGAVGDYTGAGIEMYDTDACKVVYDNMEETFSILPGSAFMHDGSMIAICDEAEDITDAVKEIRKTSMGDIYVFFKREEGKNTIDIVVTEDDTFWESASSVPLAVIRGNSDITDKRKIAKTKVGSCSANITKDITVTIPRLNKTDEPETRLKYVIPNVFPGAERVFLRYYTPNGGINCVHIGEIQSVGANNEAALEYSEIESYYHSQVAYNRVGTDLQIWMKVGYTYISERTYYLTIM